MDATFGADDWQELLARELRLPVRVTFGRARRNVLVARPENGGFHVRLSAMFASAPPDVRDAVVRWLRSGRRAKRAARLLDDWIAKAADELPPARRRAFEPRPRGEHHDLDALAAQLRPEPLDEELLPRDRWPPLTWGRRGRTGARRSLHLGSYDADQQLVRIHRVLDQAAVPAWFVRYVLFHELLHAALPPERVGGRTVFHGPGFRERERAYPDYERAKEWQAKNIDRLLRSARTGSVLRPHRRPREVVRAVQGLLFG